MFMSSIGSIAASPTLELQSTVTWSLTDKNSLVALSNSNLTATGTTSSSGTVRATSGKTTGTFYYEVVVVSPAGASVAHAIGITNGAMSLSTNIGFTTSSVGLNVGGSVFRSSANQGTIFPSLVNGDVIGIAVNVTLGRIFLRRNGGAWAMSGNPTAGTGGLTFVVSGSVYPAASCSGITQAWTARFASASWSNPAPSGYGQLM